MRNSGSWPPAAISACISASPSAKSCSTRIPSSRSASSSAIALAGVSSPTAMPIRACLVGKRGQQDRDAALGGGQRAQPRVADREPRDARAALGVGDVARHRHADRRAVGVALLERDDAAEQAPVELGDRDLRRGVERRQPGVGLPPRRRATRSRRRPGAPGTSSAASAVASQSCHVSPTPSPARRVVAGAAAAGREHRRDQRVDVAVEQLQRRHVPVGVAAQRVAPHGERVGARVLDRARQRVDEGGVARSGGASGRSRRRPSAGPGRAARAPRRSDVAGARAA